MNRALRSQIEARQYTQAAIALGAKHISETEVQQLVVLERKLAQLLKEENDFHASIGKGIGGKLTP
jgi:hypothetical protein